MPLSSMGSLSLVFAGSISLRVSISLVLAGKYLILCRNLANLVGPPLAASDNMDFGIASESQNVYMHLFTFLDCGPTCQIEFGTLPLG
jgi:hypothetical protein